MAETVGSFPRRVPEVVVCSEAQCVTGVEEAGRCGEQTAVAAAAAFSAALLLLVHWFGVLRKALKRHFDLKAYCF